jgi:hypothetical protein
MVAPKYKNYPLDTNQEDKIKIRLLAEKILAELKTDPIKARKAALIISQMLNQKKKP